MQKKRFIIELNKSSEKNSGDRKLLDRYSYVEKDAQNYERLKYFGQKMAKT